MGLRRIGVDLFSIDLRSTPRPYLYVVNWFAYGQLIFLLVLVSALIIHSKYFSVSDWLNFHG